MVEINVRVETNAFRRSLSNLEARQAPFAIALALTRTAQDVRANTISRMQRVLDRPTRFTLNAFKVVPARKNDPTAVVGFRSFTRTAAGVRSYLEPVEFGGPRPPKRFEVLLRQAGILDADEFTVPARGTRLNASGNVAASRYVQILSQLRAFNSAGFSANETARSRARAKPTRTRFFAVTKDGALPRGIYERTGRRGAKAVFIFVKQPTYRAILGFRQIAETTTALRLPVNLESAMAQAIASARLNE